MGCACALWKEEISTNVCGSELVRLAEILCQIYSVKLTDLNIKFGPVLLRSRKEVLQGEVFLYKNMCIHDQLRQNWQLLEDIERYIIKGNVFF